MSTTNSTSNLSSGFSQTTVQNASFQQKEK